MESKVLGPSIGLIVLGILGAVLGVLGLFTGGLDPEMLEEMDLPPEQRDLMLKLFQSGGALGTAMSVVGIGISVFIAWAGFQMMKLKAWTAAVVANVLIMIPCVTSCCCVIGIPMGVWGLVVLFNKDVKNAFEGQVPV